jgi:PAS domain S-box-containing protein
MSSTHRLTATGEPEKPVLLLNIDGDEAARRTRTGRLQNEGYEVLEAGTREEGLRLLAEREPDLVLLAATLPNADSAELCRRIRADADLADTPVVQISERSLDAGERVRSLESGADAYLSMAADPRVLAATVRSLLRMHRAEERARHSAARVAAILASITDAYVSVDREWRLAGMNAPAEKAFGRPAADLVGKNIWQEYPRAVGGVFYRAMHEAVEKHRVVHTEGCSHVTESWYEVHVYPSDGGLDVYFRDISDRKHAEDALRDTASYYEQLTASLPQIVWTCHADGRSDFASPQWVEYTGAPAESALDEGWLDFVHPDDRESVIASWRAVVKNHDGWDAEYRIRGRDGQYRWFKARGRPIRDQDGRVRRWFGTCTDIEDLKRAQRQRDELLGSERAARSEAERASRLKDEFVAAVSHELRTPMMAMLGWSQLLGRRHNIEPELLAEGLEVIERNVRVQAQIIDDLLDVSRMVTGKLRLNMQEADMLPVYAALDTVRPAAEAKNIQIEQEIESHPLLVAGDPARLQQICWNLLSNAVKFTDSGGCVRITLARDGPNVILQVTDTGQGIRPDVLPYVFERFRQADASTTRKHGGLGLGLAIVRNLVELHGGTIRADSAGEGRGATFTVQVPALPAQPRRDDGRVLHTLLPPRYAPASLHGVRVLVVDDEPDARDLVRRVLEEYDASVVTAETGREAIERVRSEPPDLLICDIGMPDEDGYSVIRQVRALPPERGGKMPALALTAYARPEDRDRSLEAGFDGHVTKPVQASELVGMVAQVAHVAER